MSKMDNTDIIQIKCLAAALVLPALISANVALNQEMPHAQPVIDNALDLADLLFEKALARYKDLV